MLQLLLLRHAKSSWDDAGVRDHDRPLNARGRRAAPRMAEVLEQDTLRPGRVLSSTAHRARETAELLMEAWGRGTEEITLVEELYLAPPATLVETVRRLGKAEERILVVAHNPGLEELVSRWTGAVVPFPTAALAGFAFDLDDWADLELGSPARPLGVWRPKELPEEGTP